MRRFRYSLRLELLLVCFAISVLPVLIMQVSFLPRSEGYIEQKVNSLIQKNLSYMQSNLESDLEYYKGILYRIAADDAVTQDELNIKHGDDFARESSAIYLRDLLAGYADIRDEITGVTCVNESLQSVCYDKRNMSSTNYLWECYSAAEKQRIYRTVHDAGRAVLFDTRQYYYNNETSYLYTIGLRLWDIKTGEDLGIVLMSVDEQRLCSTCGVQSDPGTDAGVNEFSFITGSDGRILSFPDKRFIGTTFSAADPDDPVLRTVFSDPDSEIVAHSVPIGDTGWNIVNLVNKNSMFAEISQLKHFTLSVTVGVLLLCAFLITFFIRKFCGSVNSVVEGMKRAKEGDFSTQVQLHGERELVFIGEEFNDMVRRIRSLVENLKQQNEYIYEISARERRAEINAIVAQINPHFLYNTLDCMNWIAIRNDDFEVSRMLGNLADILRYSIHGASEQASVYEAVEWLKKYLYLYSVRLNNSFSTVWEVDEDTLGCKMYKLLLQPVVENAVLHGFEGCTAGGMLRIAIARAGADRLRICVQDNGAGIPAGTLARLNEENPKESAGGSIGLRNVQERLRAYYQDRGVLHVESEAGRGTCVTIEIPLEE